MPRLQFECLESRENPTGPTIVDPIGISATVGVDSASSAVVTPDATADAAAIQKILQQTLAALGSGW